MITPVDYMVHLEQARSSLSPSGQRRLALLAQLKELLRNRKKKAAPRPEPVISPAPCCQPAAG